MKAKINFDENGYVSHFITDPYGDYEIDDNINFEFLYCYHLVDGEIVLDEEKRASQIAEEEKNKEIAEIAELEQMLKDTDYIFFKELEEITALSNPVTFISDFIKILVAYAKEYKDVIANRKSWRERIRELKGE